MPGIRNRSAITGPKITTTRTIRNVVSTEPISTSDLPASGHHATRADGGTTHVTPAPPEE